MINFGPSGNSDKFFEQGYTSTVQAFKWLNEMGLNAFEYSFGRGINLSSATASKIKEAAETYKVSLSVHAPYYINFANSDDEMIKKSIAYCLNSANASRQMGSDRVIVHCATVGKSTREESFNRTLTNINKLTEAIYNENYNDIKFYFETMGKLNQIGTVDEIIKLCQIDKVYYPAIDFGHFNARTHGGLNSYEDFREVFKSLIDSLDDIKLAKLHIHFSKIEYSKGGEVKHLTFNDDKYGPDYRYMLQCIQDYKLTPRIICESAGTQAEDALEMRNYYIHLENARK